MSASCVPQRLYPQIAQFHLATCSPPQSAKASVSWAEGSVAPMGSEAHKSDTHSLLVVSSHHSFAPFSPPCSCLVGCGDLDCQCQSSGKGVCARRDCPLLCVSTWAHHRPWARMVVCLWPSTFFCSQLIIWYIQQLGMISPAFAQCRVDVSFCSSSLFCLKSPVQYMQMHWKRKMLMTTYKK